MSRLKVLPFLLFFYSLGCVPDVGMVCTQNAECPRGSFCVRGLCAAATDFDAGSGGGGGNTNLADGGGGTGGAAGTGGTAGTGGAAGSGGADAGPCSLCGPYEMCAQEQCVSRFGALAWTSPQDGLRMRADSLAVTAVLSQRSGGTEAYPDSLSGIHQSPDGGTTPFALARQDGGQYVGSIPFKVDGPHLATVSLKPLSAALHVVVDETPPQNFALTLAPPPARLSTGDTLEGDPGLPGAFRRDETALATVTWTGTDLAPDAGPSCAMLGLGRDGGALLDAGVACARVTDGGCPSCDGGIECACFALDLFAPTFEAAHGQLPLRLALSDALGNTATAEPTVPVTRWKFQSRVSSQALSGSPAIGRGGIIYVTQAGNSPRVAVFGPDGVYQRSLGQYDMVSDTPVLAHIDATEDQIVLQERFSTNWGMPGIRLALYSTKGAQPSSPLQTYNAFGFSRVVQFPMILKGAATQSWFAAVAASSNALGGAGNVALIQSAATATGAEVPSGAPNGTAVAATPRYSGVGNFMDREGTDLFVAAADSVLVFKGQRSATGVGTSDAGIVSLPQLSAFSLAGGVEGTCGPLQSLCLIEDREINWSAPGGYRVEWEAGWQPQKTAAAIELRHPGDPGVIPFKSFVSGAFKQTRDTVFFVYGPTAATSDEGVGQAVRALPAATSGTLVSTKALGLPPIDKTPLAGQDGRIYTAHCGLSVWESGPKRVWGILPGELPSSDCLTTELNLDSNRAHCGKGGVLLAGSKNGKLYGFIVDTDRLSYDAPWPRYQHDPGNSGNTSTWLDGWTCP